jgi:hypothetical protein
MATYAENTSVSSDKSRSEIERTLSRYGAESFMYGWDRDRSIVGFIAHGRQIRFTLPMPDRNDRKFTLTPTGRARTGTAAAEAYEQAVKQRWRALALVIKAKLEAVETGIVTFEEEFAMHMMLPNGQTVGDWVSPQIAEVYTTNSMPALLPGAGPKEIG